MNYKNIVHDLTQIASVPQFRKFLAPTLVNEKIYNKTSSILTEDWIHFLINYELNIYLRNFVKLSRWRGSSRKLLCIFRFFAPFSGGY